MVERKGPAVIKWIRCPAGFDPSQEFFFLAIEINRQIDSPRDIPGLEYLHFWRFRNFQLEEGHMFFDFNHRLRLFPTSSNIDANFGIVAAELLNTGEECEYSWEYPCGMNNVRLMRKDNNVN